MSHSTRSIHVTPRLTSLAAALSIALASSSIGAADHKQGGFLHNTDVSHQRTYKTPKTNFAHVRNAVRDTFAALPASHPATRTPTTAHVTSTADSGPGSLRDMLSNAADGDIIDLSDMRGTLTLTSPLVPAASVTINGPGRDLLTLDGNRVDRVLTSNHSLKVSNVTIANGAAPAATPIGGCLMVVGHASLTNVKLSNCTAVGSPATKPAEGGALFVAGSLYIASSELSNNSAISTYQPGGTRNQYRAYGGAIAIYATSDSGSTIVDSVISGNSASAGSLAYGGAIYSYYYSATNHTADVTLTNTTLSGNTATATGILPYQDTANQQTYFYGISSGGGLLVRGGDAVLNNSRVESNQAISDAPSDGGGVATKRGIYYNQSSKTSGYVGGAVSMSGSTISGNSAQANYFSAYGGGVYATDDINIVTSILSNNVATTASPFAYAIRFSAAGGAVSGGYYTSNLQITASTLSGNSATSTGQSYAFGGAVTTSFQNAATVFVVTNSTISGNSVSSSSSAGDFSAVGGLYQRPSKGAASLKVYNSTIAFNSAGYAGGGVGTDYALPVGLYSSIVAKNTATKLTSTSDIGISGTTPLFTVAGDYNLVQTDPTTNGVAFAGTHNIIGSDPLLLPLANNGGATPTHALAATSPAIDAGNNPLSLPFDQRGDPYARVVGAAADIGAFELNSDQIFGNGFE